MGVDKDGNFYISTGIKIEGSKILNFAFRGFLHVSFVNGKIISHSFVDHKIDDLDKRIARKFFEFYKA